MKLICNYYIRNYGSVLQSFASYVTLTKYSDQVAVINYIDRPDNRAKAEIALRIKINYLFDYKMLNNKVRKMIHGDHDYQAVVFTRAKVFDQFNKEVFRFTKQYKSPAEIKTDLKKEEIIVIGSDQLWGPEDIIRNYHTLSWVPAGHKKVSYATSFGVSELPRFLHRRAKDFLSNMDCISVREETGVKIVKDLTSRDVPQVCDPTLLLSSQEWETIASSKVIDEPYIFCFFIGDNPDQREQAKKLRKKTGYRIAAILHLDQFIPADEGYADYVFNDASPTDFLGLIKYAEYVLCDSFHASVFSILFKKKFAIFNRYTEYSFGSRNSRIDSLCNKLNLSSRRINELDDVCLKIQANIDYKAVFEKLGRWKKESLEYLRKAIGV